MKKWQFWIDRGGTFTDIIAHSPEGKMIVHKLLSENPQQYHSAIIQGIRTVLQLKETDSFSEEQISEIKLGTTLTTNALLERKGYPTVLVTTKGFKDSLRIGYQNRPDLFALNIILPEMLYETVIEVEERVSAQGDILVPLNQQKLRDNLTEIYRQGIRSCAIVFIHGYRYPDHEKQAYEVARSIGFTNISISHEISPLIKFVSRGETTVVDAYLSPILKQYITQLSSELNHIPLLLMQSHGGLISAP